MKDILAGLPAIGSEPMDSSPETLALHNMREAFNYAQHCCRGKLSADEIYSAIYEALCHAARNFKPGGIRFFGYAKPYIRGGLNKVWRAKDVVRNKKGDCGSKRGREEYHNEIALSTEAEGKEEIHENSDGLTGIRLREKMESNVPICDPDIEAVQLREEYSLLQPMLLRLTDKEQSVIALRYKSSLTFEKIGSLLGTSRADIQFTHARALKKLRHLSKPKLGTIN